MSHALIMLISFQKLIYLLNTLFEWTDTILSKLIITKYVSIFYETNFGNVLFDSIIETKTIAIFQWYFNLRLIWTKFIRRNGRDLEETDTWDATKRGVEMRDGTFTSSSRYFGVKMWDSKLLFTNVRIFVHWSMRMLVFYTS